MSYQLRSLERSWRDMRWCRRLRLLAQAGGLSGEKFWDVFLRWNIKECQDMVNGHNGIYKWDM